MLTHPNAAGCLHIHTAPAAVICGGRLLLSTAFRSSSRLTRITRSWVNDRAVVCSFRRLDHARAVASNISRSNNSISVDQLVLTLMARAPVRHVDLGQGA